MPYNFQHKYRGRALIFGNEFLKQRNQRYGCGRDMLMMKELFSRLDFAVQLYKDFSALQMKTKIIEAREHEMNKDSDCLVIVVSSHGAEYYESSIGDTKRWTHVVFGNDMCPVFVQTDILNVLAQSESLKGKPKLLFLQACRSKDIQEDSADAFVAKAPFDLGQIINVVTRSSQTSGVISESDKIDGHTSDTLYGLDLSDADDIYKDLVRDPDEWMLDAANNKERENYLREAQAEGNAFTGTACIAEAQAEVTAEGSTLTATAPTAEARDEYIVEGMALTGTAPTAEARDENIVDGIELTGTAPTAEARDENIVKGIALTGKASTAEAQAEDIVEGNALTRTTTTSDESSNPINPLPLLLSVMDTAPSENVTGDSRTEIDAGASTGSSTVPPPPPEIVNVCLMECPQDFLIMFPVESGKVAFRHSNEGSYLLQFMRKNLHELLNGHSLLQFTTTVCGDMSRYKFEPDLSQKSLQEMQIMLFRIMKELCKNTELLHSVLGALPPQENLLEHLKIYFGRMTDQDTTKHDQMKSILKQALPFKTSASIVHRLTDKVVFKSGKTPLSKMSKLKERIQDKLVS